MLGGADKGPYCYHFIILRAHLFIKILIPYNNFYSTRPFYSGTFDSVVIPLSEESNHSIRKKTTGGIDHGEKKPVRKGKPAGDAGKGFRHFPHGWSGPSCLGNDDHIPCLFQEPLPGGACFWFDAHRDAGDGDAVHWRFSCACLVWSAQFVLQHEAVWHPGEAGRVLIEGIGVRRGVVLA